MHNTIRRFRLSWFLLSTLCVTVDPGLMHAQIVLMRDIGLETAFQDTFLGHHKRTRASIAADFDLDGYVDYYMGSPGDESFVMRNVPAPGGRRKFALQQVLLEDSLAWGGVAFDYDNDGDYDIFVTCGANEGIGYNALFRNDWILNGEVTGNLEFMDVTDIAGVAGPLPPTQEISFGPAHFDLEDDHCSVWKGKPSVMPPADVVLPPQMGGGAPVRTASANAVVADYDQDGDDDIFVSGNINFDSDRRYPALIGRNTLWKNNGDGTFTDATYEAGLGTLLAPTRNSTFIDYDNDGDKDIWENNYGGYNYLWMNNGDGTFRDATVEASLPGHDLHFPWHSFASGAADLDNDGWEDLIGFAQGANEYRHGSPYEDGHALWMNRSGRFENVASSTIINNNFVSIYGVMGCLVGDVSGDGFPDLYFGNGGPAYGVADQFYVSSPGATVPSFVDNTAMIDVAAVIPAGFPLPPYPYRTHGVCAIDYDNDGYLEMSVANGGPAAGPDIMREPNRLYTIRTVYRYVWLKVRPIGDGVVVARDAVGTRVRIDVSNTQGKSWSVYRTLYAGSAFSAQSGFTLHFGLADASQIDAMTVTWPDGSTTPIHDGIEINHSIEVSFDGLGAIALKGSASESTRLAPEKYELNQNYPNPFNPSTTIDYALPFSAHVTLEVFNVLGQRVRVLRDGVQDAGYYSVVFEAKGLPSGAYFYRLSVVSQARRDLVPHEGDGQTEEFIQTGRMMLML